MPYATKCRFSGFMCVGLAAFAAFASIAPQPAAAQNCSIFTGGNPCNRGCPDECSPILCPANAACSDRCVSQPQCRPLCGGDACGAGCPDQCSPIICPGNATCNPACGASRPECNILCGGDACGPGCPDACSLAICPQNHCDCVAQPQCDVLCGGNPCNAGCPDACSPVICPDNAICNPACGASQPECNILCGGDACGPGCPDECSFAICPQNHCDCVAQPQCDVLCGGDICGSGCPDECNPVLCPGNATCSPACGVSQPECNILCGGDPCGSGCPDECSPILCSDNPCSSQSPCGGEGERACCAFERIPSCNPGLIEAGGCTGDCGFLDCSLGTCVDPQCGGEGERACCVNEQALLGVANCEAGLIEVEEVLGTGGCAGDCACIGTGSLGLSSSGMCHRFTPCGGVGQRACCLAERLEPCDPGLVEVPGCSGDCFCGAGVLNKVNDGIEGTSSSTCVRFEDITEPTVGFVQPASADVCPMRGYIDMHLHLFADLAHGGAALAGRPFFDDLAGEDVNDALRPCYATEDVIVDTDGQIVTLADTMSSDGGCTLWGTVFSAADCPEDLVGVCGADSSPLHGCHGVFDEAVGSFVGTADGAEFSLGAPAFSDWPQWSTTTHQQAYYKWMERAWRGGLRLTTMLAVTNGALCKGGKRKKYLDDAQTIESDCDDSMAFIDLQLAAAYDFEAFVDRQSGGPGQGWFRIVLTPAEARSVIAEGKMAVVLGIEMANLFNCSFVEPGEIEECTPVNGIIQDPAACEAALDENSGCTREFVEAEVDRYYDEWGVRHIFPIHNFDNAFGGPATWQDAIELGNRIIEGHWWNTRDCSSENYGFGLGAALQLAIGMFKFGDEVSDSELSPLLASRGVGVSGDSFPQIVLAILDGVGIVDLPDRIDCNEFGLFPLGNALTNKLMKRGMIIDVDHMSTRALDDTIALAGNFDRDNDGTPDPYPLVASHTIFFDLNEQGIRHERMRTAAQLQAIRDLGGMIAVMLKDDVLDTDKRGERQTLDYANSGVVDDCRHSSKTFAQAYRYAVDQMGGPVALGSDFNGVAGHFGPRFGSDACGGDESERSQQLLANNRLQYPFTLNDFGTFDKQVSGQKTFDYNVHGLAHVGLLPDMIADLKRVGLSEADLDPLFRSAEAYIQMWERARGEPVIATCNVPADCQSVCGDGCCESSEAPNDCPQDCGSPPELVRIMGGLGSAPDTFISALGEDVPFDTIDVDFSTDVELISTGAGLTLTPNGGGNHTLTLDTPVPAGACVGLPFDVRDPATGAVATMAFTVCHLPLDVNQDRTVNIQDITAWGMEFGGNRRAGLVDTNGDGNVNVQDATRVGVMWFGRPPATRAWNGESLP